MYTKLISEMQELIDEFVEHYKLEAEYNQNKKFEVFLILGDGEELMYVFVEDDEFKKVTPVRIQYEIHLSRKVTTELNKKMLAKGVEIGGAVNNSREYCINIDTNNMSNGLSTLEWAIMELIDYTALPGDK